MAKKKAPAANPLQPLTDAAKAGDEKEVLRILDAGTDVNAPLSPNFPMTTLDYAIAYEHPELAQKLLDRGAKPTAMTQRSLRASTPEKIFTLVGVNEDIKTLAFLNFFEKTSEGRAKLMSRYMKHGLKLTQASLYWLFVGIDATDEKEAMWAIDLHLEAKVKLDVNATIDDQVSLMECALRDLPLGVVKRFVEMGGKIAPGRKVEDGVEDSAAKKKWLAANFPRGKAKGGLELFSNLTDDELTDDVIVATLIGKEVFPDRAAWKKLTWEENAADTRAHMFEDFGGGLRYEFFINSDGDWNQAVASSKALYTRLYTELTKVYGKTKKGAKHTDWDAGVHLELREAHENPYGPFGDHWTGIAVQLDT